MPRHSDKKLHLVLQTTPQLLPYSKQGGGSYLPPKRDRNAHGKYIQNSYQKAIDKAEQEVENMLMGVAETVRGYYLDFELSEGFSSLEKLDVSDFELIRVKESSNGSKLVATIFVPKDKIGQFQKKIKQYLEEDTKPKKDGSTSPKNQKLIDSINSIDSSNIRSLWCDSLDSFPKDGSEVFWWEVYVLASQEEKFRETCQEQEVVVDEGSLKFPDRIVFCVNTNTTTMAKLQLQTGAIAELRHLKSITEFFISLNPQEQADWIKELEGRIEWPNEDAPSVCLLDTGVNHGHPLIVKAIKDEDLHTYDPNWSKGDGLEGGRGHGTAMAGVALYGDLGEVLTSDEIIQLKHRLESVRVLPEIGRNPKRLYGSITQESVYRVETKKPHHLRNFCMAITLEKTPEEKIDGGTPSSWSAAIDQLSVGADATNQKRLMIVSAGNIRDKSLPIDYFERCQLEQIEDPAQSWNSLTVGAFTNKVSIDDPDFRGWKPIASAGDLSPLSRTSSLWQGQWPIKPEIVLEGGNQIKLPDNKQLDICDDLGLLTTHHVPTTKFFESTHGTSPATAQAARMAAIVQANHPYFWPETLRALLVHSAEWTEAMQKRLGKAKNKTQQDSLIRCFGYGVPSLERAIWSAQNAVTLISQNEIQPFIKKKMGSEAKMNKMHLFELPWPKEVLEELSSEEVRLRITLSYFIEPNPSDRGYQRRYTYGSHGLRFSAKQPDETLEQFQWRINKFLDEGEEAPSNTSQSGESGWIIGKTKRDKGSIHSDIWEGRAVDLAERGIIAIYPVGGWWKTHNGQKKWNKKNKVLTHHIN